MVSKMETGDGSEANIDKRYVDAMHWHSVVKTAAADFRKVCEGNSTSSDGADRGNK